MLAVYLGHQQKLVTEGMGAELQARGILTVSAIGSTGGWCRTGLSSQIFEPPLAEFWWR